MISISNVFDSEWLFRKWEIVLVGVGLVVFFIGVVCLGVGLGVEDYGWVYEFWLSMDIGVCVDYCV